MKRIAAKMANVVLLAACGTMLGGCMVFNCGGPNGCFGAPWH